MAWENVERIKTMNDTYFNFCVLDTGVYGAPPTTGTKQPPYGEPLDANNQPTYANGAACQAMYQDAIYRGAYNFQNPSNVSGSVTFKGGGRISWTVSGVYVAISFTIAGCQSTTISTALASNQAWFIWLQVDWTNEKANIGYANGNIELFLNGRYNYFQSVSLTSDADLLFRTVVSGLVKPPPYLAGGTSEPGGGKGNYDDASDSVTMPGVPPLNLSINGFVTAYAPTITQINDLATFIWSDWLSGGPTLPKIFANPEDAIISLHMLPFTPSTSSAIEVTVGHYASGVQMDPMTNQFYTINCGSLAIEEYWGNYLDYNPYTKLTLFLPYVGEITLNPDEVMTRTITIKYRVDAMTGAFVCFILRDDDKILGEYQGNCSLEVPISSANYAQLHSALLGLAGSAVGMAAGAAGSGISGLLSGGTNVLTSAAGMMDSKIRHSHSGALGSASGFMGSQSPYLIIERARQCLPVDLNKFAGYPSQITETLGDLSGFTSVSEIILDGIPLTDEELAELREILKGGVYL